MSDLPILISGAGIGGVSTALALARAGRRALVLERSPVLGEIGAGIQLGPNAFHVFDRLGVGEAARNMAVFIDSLRLMDAMTAEEITRIPLDLPFRERFGNPYAVIHRGDLHGVLLRAAQSNPLIEIRTNAEVLDYDQDDKSVTITLKGDVKIRGSMLIGADGLWSNIRKRVVGDGAPRVSGHTTYRSVIPTELMPEDLRWNAATLWAGPKCHIVHYPLSGWKYFNLVVTCHNDAKEPAAGVSVTYEEVLHGFSHVADRAQGIIRHGQDWKYWVLCDREPVQKWQDGRVVLLGDAAHPMMQYFAQGACMAMEDAVVIADALQAHSGDPQRAIPAYIAARNLRTSRVQLQSRWIGENIYHPAGAHAELRNEIMRRKTPSEWYDSVAWLYGGLQNGAGEHIRAAQKAPERAA